MAGALPFRIVALQVTRTFWSPTTMSLDWVVVVNGSAALHSNQLMLPLYRPDPPVAVTAEAAWVTGFWGAVTASMPKSMATARPAAMRFRAR